MDSIDVKLAADPRCWPRWPWLPLKRHQKGRPQPQMGVLHADTAPDTKPVILYNVNVFNLRGIFFPTEEMPEAARYDSWADFAKSDWMID